ncbi:MAG: hypothetical protein AABY37_05475 [Actinomycetota bacterium]
MKRFRFLLIPLVLALIFPALAQSATKTIYVKTMTRLATLSDAEQVSGMLVNGKIIYLFGTVSGEQGTDGFVRTIDGEGATQWSLSLDTGADDIATTATRDTSGNIWVVGSTAKLVTNVSSPSASPSSSILNPDGVTLDPELPLRNDLTTVVIWKVSASGVLLATYISDLAHPVLVRAVTATSTGIALVGIISTVSGNAGFVLQSDFTGTFAKPLLIGKSDTEVNALAKKSNGSLVVLGSSTETISGKVLQGARDGIIASVSAKGKLTSLVRSSNSKSVRSWQSATNSLFFGGDAVLNGKIEAVVTKFSSAIVPTWTTRFSAKGPAFTFSISARSHVMAFSPIGAIKGVKGWKPSKDQVLALIFDGKGVLTGAYRATAIQTPIAMGYSRDLGLVVLGSGAIGVSIFHALPR